MNIALKTGDLMRKSDKKFYLFQKFLPRAQNKFVTGQFHPITFYGNVTEGSSLEEKIKIGWKFLGANLAGGLGLADLR